MKLKFFLSPFFINRLYLYRDTKQVTDKYIFRGNALDIGCGEKPYRKLFKDIKKYDGIDFEKYSKNDSFESTRPDFFFDNRYLKNSVLPFKNDSYDHSFAFQVLEHHNNPAKLIKEMFRITKKEGYLFLTVPFLGGIHEEPYDYQRFTKYGLMELLRPYKCKVVELRAYGSIFSTLSLLLNEHLCHYVNKGKLNRLIGTIIYPPFLLAQYVSYFLDKIISSEHVVRGYLLLIKKQ